MPAGREAFPDFEGFLRIWRELQEESERAGTVVVVEGDRDRRALRRLGLRGPIVMIHRGRRLAETAQSLVGDHRRVIVLTDWDTEGGHFAHRLQEFLAAETVDLDLQFRRRLARILRGELVHVEGLHGWARRLAERRGESLEIALGPADPEDGPAPTE